MLNLFPDLESGPSCGPEGCDPVVVEVINSCGDCGFVSGNEDEYVNHPCVGDKTYKQWVEYYLEKQD